MVWTLALVGTLVLECLKPKWVRMHGFDAGCTPCTRMSFCAPWNLTSTEDIIIGFVNEDFVLFIVVLGFVGSVHYRLSTDAPYAFGQKIELCNNAVSALRKIIIFNHTVLGTTAKRETENMSAGITKKKLS